MPKKVAATKALKSKPRAKKTTTVKTPKVDDHQLVLNLLTQLYLHSRHARFSLACVALFGHPTVSAAPKPQGEEQLVDQDEEDEYPKHHWIHMPYPYAGHLRIVTSMAGFLVLVVLAQIMYPSGRTLPLSRLSGNGYIGLKTQAEVDQKIAQINASNVTVNTRDSSVSTSYANMGVKANGEETFKQLADYPFEKRLIPFSFLFSDIKSTPVSRDINVEKLTSFTKSIVTVASKEAKNAAVTMQGNRLIVSPSEDGYEYEQNSLQHQVAKSELSQQPITLEPKTIPAQISTSNAQTSVSEMQKRIDSGLTISAADQNLQIGAETVASWVIIQQKPEVRTVNLYFDKAKVAASLKPIVATVDLAGTPDQVTLLNGVEAGRKYGTPGRTLQFDDLVNQVASSTDWTVGLIQAKVTNEPVKQNYTRRYTRDSLGLQSLLDYWTKNNKGRYAAEVRSQNGRMQASINGNQSFSGTYKLYLPTLAYGRFTTRNLNPGFTTSTGFTSDGCVDRVVLSGNDQCAMALGDLIDWGDNNSLLNAQGFENTFISRGSGSTTANDGADWAEKLLSGSLTTVAQKNTLINLMSEQNLRGGIPSGASGVSVANRAGQSGSVRYDVGIVYHPRGTYVLSIFSDGGSFAGIADLAREVNTVMSQ